MIEFSWLSVDVVERAEVLVKVEIGVVITEYARKGRGLLSDDGGVAVAS